MKTCFGLRVTTVAFVAFFLSAGPARAENSPVADLAVDEHLGSLLALDEGFVDEGGKAVRLGDYYDGKRPTVLIFGYHSCPMLCSLIQSAAARSLRDVGWQVGPDLQVIMISIDPRDNPMTATKRRDVVVAQYGRDTMEPSTVRDAGWHFLTSADRGAIDAVTASAGYHYAFDTERKQYVHPAVILVTTPEGRIARYLYGMEYKPADVRLALIEAAAGHSVSTVDRVLLFCARYDPTSGHYVVAMRVIQVGSLVIFALLSAVLGFLWNRERKRLPS